MTFSDRNLPIGVEPSKPDCAHCCDTGWLNPESKTDLTPCPHCDPDNQPAEESAGDGYSQRDYEMDCAQEHYEEMKAGNANHYRIFGR